MVIIIKILAKASGLVNVDFASVKVIANPVTEGLEKARLISKIAETIFSMNNEILIFIYLYKRASLYTFRFFHELYP